MWRNNPGEGRDAFSAEPDPRERTKETPGQIFFFIGCLPGVRATLLANRRANISSAFYEIRK